MTYEYRSLARKINDLGESVENVAGSKMFDSYVLATLAKLLIRILLVAVEAYVNRTEVMEELG